MHAIVLSATRRFLGIEVPKGQQQLATEFFFGFKRCVYVYRELRCGEVLHGMKNSGRTGRLVEDLARVKDDT